MRFAEVFVTVLVIMDPVGSVPVFLALTTGLDAHQRRRAARHATLAAAGIILGFAAFGEQLLLLLGISLEALQVSGGLLLVLVAVELLQVGGVPRRPSPAGGMAVALVPLGTPLLAGPGAIAATMVHIRDAGALDQVAVVVAALLAVLAVVHVVLRLAAPISRVLGANGIDLLSRVVGLLVAAIAVELVATGVQEWVRSGV